MNEQAIWGLLLILYVVPFWIWQFSEFNKIEARKKIHAGRTDEVLQESRFNNLSLLWCVGLAAVLAAWKAEWHPIGSAIALFIAILVMLAVRFSVRRLNLKSKRLFRFWAAGSFIWVLVIGGAYLVFDRVSALNQDEFIFLAFTPPIIAALAISAWRWAVRRA